MTATVGSTVRSAIATTNRKPFTIDAALPDDARPAWAMATQYFGTAIREWRQRITADELLDIGFSAAEAIHHSSLILSPADGALLRREASHATGLAYTRWAWQQLVSLLLQQVPQRPSGAAGVSFWLNPDARALAFRDFVTRSKRANHKSLVFRTFRHSSGLRALRAVVSERHSGIYYDDTALIAKLEEELPHAARARVHRSINMTQGYCELTEEAASVADASLTATLHWRNSETNCASLSFHGGARIRFLDAVVRDAKGAILTEEDAQLPSAGNVMLQSVGTRVRTHHTIPRRHTTDGERQDIAAGRMDKLIRQARAAADTLISNWQRALESFPEGFSPSDAGLPLAFDVLLDYAEEQQGMEAEDKLKLLKLLKDDKRLTQVPHGSAAHMACAYAVLANLTRDYDEATRLQEKAGEWLASRW